MKIEIPGWLTVIVVIETLPMFLGPLAAMLLPSMLGGAGAGELNQAAFIYAARNLAVGFAFIIACLLKNGSMLFILIFVRLITDLLDLPTVLYFDLVNNVPLAVSVFIFLYYIPPVIALWYLWGKFRDKGGSMARA